jgi:hypothetical protein
MISPRYVAIGREVWDAAWSSPREGTWTAGLKREAVVTLYPSGEAAIDVAQSLNDNEPTTMAERAARFQAAAANALADKAEQRCCQVNASARMGGRHRRAGLTVTFRISER